jgi:hypothetical protein
VTITIDLFQENTKLSGEAKAGMSTPCLEWTGPTRNGYGSLSVIITGKSWADGATSC